MGRVILYNCQTSMYNKITGKLTPEADGNINMMRNTILEWRKYYPKDTFAVLLPSELKDSFKKLLPGFVDPIFYDDYVVSARVNRYNFPMNQLSSIIREKKIKIDIFINDVIEVTGNFKQMFKINFGYTPKIISNIRHTDESIESNYIYRVMDGIKQSDIVTILSDSMIPRLVQQLFSAGINGDYISNMFTDHNLTVFEPSVSSDELFKYSRFAKILNADEMIITFPGRLSYGEENRTNWDKFQEAIIMLREKRQDFDVYFTDPNGAMTDMLKENLLGWIHTIPKDRREFLSLLDRTDIIVSLMDVEGFGGISIREGLIMGCLPVIPYKDEYKRMARKDYPGFVESPINAEDLCDKLSWAIDKLKQDRKKKIHTYENYGLQFSIEEQFKKIKELLEVLDNE